MQSKLTEVSWWMTGGGDDAGKMKFNIKCFTEYAC